MICRLYYSLPLLTVLSLATFQQTVKICIVGTGYDLGHSDLPDSSHGITGYNDASIGDWFTDDFGHDTHVAGIIGAIGNSKGESHFH